MSDAIITVMLDRRLERLVPGFLTQCRQQAGEIERFEAAGQWRPIAEIGHNLRGSGGFYKFDEISVLGGEIERAARLRDAAAVKSSAARLKDYLARVRPQFV